MSLENIDRRTAIIDMARGGLAAVLALRLPPMVNRGRMRVPGLEREYSERAIRLVRETVVIDMLNGFETTRKEQPGNTDLIDRWLRDPLAFTEADYRQYRSSGIRVLNLGWVPADYAAALDSLAKLNGFIAAHEDWFQRVDRIADIDRLGRNEKIGLLLGFQASDHFRRVEDVDYFFGLGQRVAQLTYNVRNLIGSGAFERKDDGLTTSA